MSDSEVTKLTQRIKNDTLNPVKFEEQHSEDSPGYHGEVPPKQPRPPRQTEYTVTPELREALQHEIKVRGRSADLQLVDALTERFKGYVFHRSSITKIADGTVVASKIAWHLAVLLGCPIPPVHGSEIGDAWSKLQQLKELDSDLYRSEVEQIEKAIAHLMALKRIRDRPGGEG